MISLVNHSPARIVQFVSKYIYLISRNKQTNKKNKKSKNKLKMKRKYLRKINLKKLICGHPGEDFSRHPHFRKQEHFSFWP